MIQELSDTKLGGPSGRKFASADGKHVLVSQHRKGARPNGTYGWSIYDVSSGKMLGEMTSPVSAAPFVVIDAKLIYTTPEMSVLEGRQLRTEESSVRARDLGSNEQLWSYAIRSTTLKGPFPQ